MKKGFTLVEMLIVVVVLVTLMTMTFRLTSIGSDQSKRNTTVARIQRLENCLSGYYAAFGTYPPVRLHGSRNYRLEVSDHGIQNLDGKEKDLKWSWFNRDSHSVSSSRDEEDDWEMVKAACKAQPVDCKFPFPQDGHWSQYVRSLSDELSKRANSDSKLNDRKRRMFGSGFSVDVRGSLGAYNDKSEWRDIQLFKFGLMSFLLPRYLVMMDSDSSLYRDHAQWTDNNSLPCDPLTGRSYNNWQALQQKANSDNASDIAHVANIPSQAVCARWMPNLEGSCRCSHEFTLFGVDIRDSEAKNGNGLPISYSLEIFSPGGFDNDSTSGQYILDGVTIMDGWDHEFYYYSPAPYQTYVLWSAGPNDRTFPPWVSKESLDSKASECVGYWTEDDIVNMSH